MSERTPKQPPRKTDREFATDWLAGQDHLPEKERGRLQQRLLDGEDPDGVMADAADGTEALREYRRDRGAEPQIHTGTPGNVN